MMQERHEVEWSYTNQLGYCYTEHETFRNESDQQKFAFMKFHETNVYEVRTINERIWRKD